MRTTLFVVSGLLAIAAIAAGVWYATTRSTDTVLRLPGIVEVQEVRLGSKIGGRVTTVSVREGQLVEPGTVLVTFDSAELVARRDQARHQYEAAQAALRKSERGPRPEEIAEAKATADAAEARLAKMTAGFRVEQKEQARQDVRGAEAELKRADEELARQQALARTPAVAQPEYDAAVATRGAAASRLAAARAALALMLHGNRPEDIAEARAELARAAAQYELLRNGTREEDKAAAYAVAGEAAARLAEAETALAEVTVSAPERCTIDVVSVRPGDIVPPGQPVVRALRTGDLWVKVFVPSTDLGRLRLGQAVEVAGDAHPSRRFHGLVTYIASVSEFTPRNVQSLDERRHQVFAVKVRVDDPEGVFKSGMAAEVFVDVSEGR